MLARASMTATVRYVRKIRTPMDLGVLVLFANRLLMTILTLGAERFVVNVGKVVVDRHTGMALGTRNLCVIPIEGEVGVPVVIEELGRPLRGGVVALLALDVARVVVELTLMGVLMAGGTVVRCPDEGARSSSPQRTDSNDTRHTP